MNIKRNIMLWLLILTSALLLSIPFLYPHLGLIALIAFVPLLAAEQIATQSKKRFFFIYYYTCFLIWNLATTYWIINATLPGMIAAVVLNALQMAVVFRLFRWMRTITRGFLPYLFLIVTWLAWEHAYFEWDVSWPWLVLGNAFATSIKSIQWYEYTGTLGGSLWILLVNTLIFRFIQKLLNSPFLSRQNIAYTASLSLLIALPLIISHIIFNTYKEIPYEPSSNTAAANIDSEKYGSRQFSVLQPNIDPYKRKFSSGQHEQNAILFDIAHKAISAANSANASAQQDSIIKSGVDFVIAPETFLSLPPFIEEHEPLKNKYFQEFYFFTRLCNNSNFIFGGVTEYNYYDYVFKRDKKGSIQPPTLTSRCMISNGRMLWYDRSNTAIFVDANGKYDFYHKSKLVVLVESTPYKKLFDFMSRFEIDLGGAIGSYAPQAEREVFTTPDSVKIGTAICYESVYGDYYREYILKGAHVMSIITNDGWWGDTPGYHQHLSYASLRAIETRRSIARSANTGISAFINQRGEIVEQTAWWEPAYLNGRLNLNDKITVFVKYGDIIGRLSGFIFFLLALMGVVRSISRRYIAV